MKIIQNDVYSSDKWHTSKQNIWSTSYLQGTLNTTYWDTISSTYQAMIDQNHIWKIGASSHEATRAEAYSNLSADTWTGKVGLMNTADYGYATNGTNCDTAMNTWPSSGGGEPTCYNVANNWLANTSMHQWTMIPYATYSKTVLLINLNGNVSWVTADSQQSIRPALYLNRNVVIAGGEGTEEKPYQLELSGPKLTLDKYDTNNKWSKKIEVTAGVNDEKELKSFTYEIIKNGESIETKNVTVSGKNGTTKIVLDQDGMYTIKLKATNTNDVTNEIISGVYKIDTTPPTLTIPEDSTINITEVSGYDLLEGVKAEDNTGTIPSVSRSGELSASEGSYVITYTAIDEAGNEATATRRITVINVPGPIIGLSNETTEGIWTKAQTITATVSSTVSIKTFTYEVIKDGVSEGVKTVNGNSVGIPLNGTGKYQIKLTAKDEYDQETLKTSGEYMIDTTAPSAPTSMEFVYGDWSRYTQNTWTNQSVYVASTQSQNGPSGSSDEHSGIEKYQISSDGSTWVDYSYSSSNNRFVPELSISNLKIINTTNECHI